MLWCVTMSPQSLPRLLLIDRDPGRVAALSAAFNGVQRVETKVCDVRTVPRDGATFVSPSNSLGFMDGGIDDVYSRKMFPGVQLRLQERIASVGMRTLLGRPYLPVGSAIVLPCGGSTFLVAAPTMFLPHNVSSTRNAYRAMMAVFCALQKAGLLSEERRIVCPALCCGFGMMPEQEAAKQMAEAYSDFCAGRNIPTERLGDDVFLGPQCDFEQPRNFDNREIHQ